MNTNDCILENYIFKFFTHGQKTVFLIFLCLIFLFTSQLSAVDYYVKPSGDNSAAGTSWSTAWRTIQYAATNMTNGDRTYVTNDIYYEQIDIINKTNITIIGLKPNYLRWTYLLGNWYTNYAFNIKNCKNVRIKNFRMQYYKNAMVYLTNSVSCIISNNYIAENNPNYTLASGIILIDSSYNIIEDNRIQTIKAPVTTGECFGIHLYHAHTNNIIDNVLYNCGDDDIYCHGIYLLNSTGNLVYDNYISKVEHYGIHVVADNTKGAPYLNLANFILDNNINILDMAIVTETTDPGSMVDSLKGQIIGRNDIQYTGKGIIWDAETSGTAGSGGMCFKNRIYSEGINNSYLEGVVFKNSPKVFFTYNTVRGFYNGLVYDNNQYSITNNVFGSNYNLNIVQNGGSGAQSIHYCITQSLMVGSGISSGIGNLEGDPLFTDDYYSWTRLKWNSPCIQNAKPGSDGVQGCMGAHTSYLSTSNKKAGLTTTYTLTFVTSPYKGDIPDDGKIKVIFPDVFSFTSPGVVSHNMGGSLAVSSSGCEITFTRSGGSVFNSGTPLQIVFSGVNNSFFSSDNYYADIIIMSNNNTIIEKEESNNFLITEGPHFMVISTNSCINGTNMMVLDVPVMNINIIDSKDHKLKSIKIGNAGTMLPGTDIKRMRMYHDANTNLLKDRFETNMIALTWNGNYWSNGNVMSSNMFNDLEYPGGNYVVIVDYETTVSSSRYFKAYIPAGGIVCSSNTNAPASALTNQGEVWNRLLFYPKQNLGMRLRGSDVAVGELNNDNYLDFIMMGNNSTSGPNKDTYRFFNNQDGTFSSTLIIPGGYDLGANALCDVDQDGDLDLFTVGGTDGGVDSVRVRFNNGSGSFGGSTYVASSMTHGDIIVGDLDNDGDLDLISAGGGRLQVCYNNGNGTFTSPQNFGIGVTYCSVALGDMDNDNDLDLIVSGSGRLDYYENYGNGVFSVTQPFGYGNNRSAVAIGDLNSDGWLDIIVTGYYDQYDIIAYINNKDGTYTAKQFGRQYNLCMVALGDIDNDGDLDLVVCAEAITDLYFNYGDGNFTDGIRLYSGSGEDDDWRPYSTTALADFDNDGDLDLILNNSWDNARVYENISKSTNTAPYNPVNLYYEIEDYKWKFNWAPNPVSDDHTQDNTLRYKIVIGTNQSGVYDYMSDAMDYPRGQANIGNIVNVTGCSYLSDIPNYKTAYWRVWSIDTSFIFSDTLPESDATPVGQGPFYVATNGDDSNPGTNGAPFRTIQKAIDVMSMGPTNINFPWCYVGPGVYKEDVVIRSNKNPDYIWLTAWSNNNPPVLDGSTNSIAFFITNTSLIRISGFEIHSYTNSGIKVMGQSSNIWIFRNLIRDNPTNICIKGTVKNAEFYNNTIFNSTSGDGIFWQGYSSGIMCNNIFLSNQGYGMKLVTTGTVHIRYNDFYGNTSGATNGNFIWGTHNYINDPMLDTSTSFTITSRYSYALDTATNIVDVSDVYIGPGPDMGWKESSLSNIHHGPFYVDVTNGLDQYPGTWDRPFKTIQKAVDRISGGDQVTSATCFVLPGTYREYVYISLNNNPGYMVFKSYFTNDYPILDGTDLYYGDYGIRIHSADRVMIDHFKIKAFNENGVYLTGTAVSNIIMNCESYSNGYHGIYINSENADYNVVKYNRLHDNVGYDGIPINAGDYNMVFRNRIYNNNRYGVYCLGAAYYNQIVNNTIVNNNEDGIRNGGENYFYNNIIMFNQQYGISQGGSTARAGYNIVYGNAWGPWDDVYMDPLNFLGVDPMIDTVSSFTITSRTSPAVDNGTIISNISDVYNGYAPDIGWKESTFSSNHKYVHILSPVNIWTNTINNALTVTSNDCIIECHIPPWKYNEQIRLNRYTNVTIRAAKWITEQDNLSTVLCGKGCENLITITNSKNIEIIGFCISNSYYNAINLTETESNKILNNYFISNRQSSIYSYSENADHNYIASNHICKSRGTGVNYGIWLRGGDNNIIVTNKIYQIQNYGVLLQLDSQSNVITRNIIYSNYDYAVYMDNDANDFTRIISNQFINNYSGIYIANADYSTIKENYFEGIPGTLQLYGIDIRNALHHVIYSNVIKKQRAHGIYFAGTVQSNRIVKNDICSNGNRGIVFDSNAVDYNQIVSNRIYYNSGYGIYLNYADDTIIKRNLIIGNDFGIVAGNSAEHNMVINNTICFNTDDGLYGNGSVTIYTAYNNVFMSNGRYGIYQYSAGGPIYAGYNVFYNNQNMDWTVYVNLLGGNIVDSDPLLNRGLSFIITNSNSPCVDSGTNYYNEWYDGTDIDIGWKESPFSNAPVNWVHISPMDIWTRDIFSAMLIVTNNCLIECYPKPDGFPETVRISGYTNLVLRSFEWTNSRDNVSTKIKADLFNRALVITNSKNIIIKGLTISNANNHGIYIVNALSNNIVHNRIIDHGESIGDGSGIYIESDMAGYHIIASNEIYNTINNDQDHGIYLMDNDQNTIFSNRIHHQREHGIYLNDSASNNIYNNVIYNNGFGGTGYGIWLYTDLSEENKIKRNIIMNTNASLDQNDAIRLYYSDKNSVISNILKDNADYGIYMHTSGGLVPRSNQIKYNQIYNSTDDWNQNLGIYNYGGDRNIFYSNIIYNHRNDGIYFDAGCQSNEIVKNVIYSNGYGAGDRNGIYLYSGNDQYNKIMTNILSYNRYEGIYIRYGDNNIIARNLLNQNRRYGMVLVGALNSRVINNTVFKSGLYDGIHANSSTGLIYNNISLSNTRAGIYVNNSTVMTAGYNCLYGNGTSPWTESGGTLVLDAGNIITADPMIDTVTSFTIISSNSPCVDTAKVFPVISTNYYGYGPDIGWKESGYTNQPDMYVHILPNNTWERSITEALENTDTTNGCILKCHPNPYKYTESISIAGFTNLRIFAYDWTNSRNNSTTILDGSSYTRSVIISNSKNITIEGFTISNASQYGVYIVDSISNKIYNNRIMNHGWYGNNYSGIRIATDNDDYNVIASNSIFNNNGVDQDFGIHLLYGDHNIIENNWIYNNEDYGILLDTGDPQSNIIQGNYIFNTNINDQDYGIYINSTEADYNQIMYNKIYNQDDYAVYANNADHMDIIGNHIFNTNSTWQNYGLYIDNGKYNLIRTNDIYRNQYNGIHLNTDCISNIITLNHIYSNGRANAGWTYENGVFANNNNNNDNNTIASNKIYGNYYAAIFVYGGDHSQIYQNLGHHNVYGIMLYSGTENTKVINNTLCFNSINGLYAHGSVTLATTYNNIFMSNSQYAINRVSGTVVAGYNCFYNNASGPWTTGVNITAGNVIDFDPMLDTVSSYTIVSSNSVCIDSAQVFEGISSNYYGAGPDMGWKESQFTNRSSLYVHVLPVDQWTRSISAGIEIATNNSKLICYPKPGDFLESVTISGYTNIHIYSDAWTNTRDNTNTIIKGDYFNYCIFITNSKNIVIEGFSIVNSLDHGILIKSAVSNKIVNNRIYNHGSSGNHSGIRIETETADYNVIASNYIYNDNTSYQDQGIYITDSDHTVICSNRIYENNETGVYITGTSMSNYIVQNRIFNETITYQDRGIYIYSADADFNQIISNNIYNQTYAGIQLQESDYNNVKFNTIYDTGFWVQDIGVYAYDSDHNVIYSNEIYNNWDNSSSYGICIYHNNNSSQSNFVIKNTLWSNYYGIYCYNTMARDNYILTNRIYNNYRGICLYTTRYTKVYRNLLYNNVNIGVYMRTSSYYNDIINNTFFNNYRGIYLTGSTANMTNNVFCNHTGYGIFINDGAADSCPYDYNVFWDNASHTNNIAAFLSGSSNHYGPPILNTAGDFEILSSFSYCVDRGKQIPGVSIPFQQMGPDIGWKESVFSATNRPEVVHIIPMNIWTNSITNALKVATNNCIIECHPESGSFVESVVIGDFTNLTLRAYDWTNSGDNTTTVIDAVSFSYGVFITNSRNITVLGFSIINAVHGICISNAVSNHILHNRIYDNTENGILLAGTGTSNNIIASNQIFNLFNSEQDFAVRIRNSSFHTFYSNTFYDNEDYAVYMTGESRYNNFYNNRIGNIESDYQNQAFVITDGDYNIINNNSMFKHAYDGFYIDGTARSNYIINNLIYSNGYISGNRHGIYLNGNGVDFNFILTNQIFNNRYDGIYNYHADYNQISRNRIYNNNRYGIYNYYYAHSSIINNVIINNASYGIRGYDRPNFDVCNNIIVSNGSYGIYASASTTIRANYNLFYNNIDGPWSTEVTALSGNILGLDPQISGVSSFTIYSASSPAVDNGTNYYSELFNGNNIDIGWKESSYTQAVTNYVYILPPMNRWTNTINNALSVATNNCTIRCYVNPLSFSESVRVEHKTNIRIYAYDWETSGDNSSTVINAAVYNQGIIITNSKDIVIEGFSIAFAIQQGIDIIDSKNNRIIYNMIHDNNQGVHITNSFSNYIVGNTIYNNDETGVYIGSEIGKNFVLSNSILDFNQNFQDYGVWINDSDNNTFYSNMIINNEDYGVYVTGTALSNVFINNQIISNRQCGFYLNSDQADYNQIRSNCIFGPEQDYGIWIIDSDHTMIFTNIIFYQDEDGIYLTQTAQSNVVLKNIIFSNTDYGIHIESDSADYNDILDNSVFYNYSGIYIRYADYCYIYKNDCYGLYDSSQYYGVLLRNTTAHVIRSNKIHHNLYNGIHLYDSCNSNSIVYNTICSNGNTSSTPGSAYRYLNGIALDSGSESYNEIMTNHIYGNNRYYGIHINGADYTKIVRNIIRDNSYGIVFRQTSLESDVINNTICYNANDGIYCDMGGSTFVDIYNNIIMSNGAYGVNYVSGSLYIGYNCFYNNTSGPWDYGEIRSGNLIGYNPMIDNTALYTISSSNSLCVDSALIITNISSAYIGFGPDMGWKESQFSNRSQRYVHLLPGNIWRSTIDGALTLATNNCTLICYPKPEGYNEQVYIQGFTNFLIRAHAWTNSGDNTITVIKGNVFTRAVVITNSKNITLQGFTVTNAINYGIVIADAISNTISHNRMYKNGTTGGDSSAVRIVSGDHNTISSNYIFDPPSNIQDYGIHILDGKHNIICSNRIYDHQDYGICFETGQIISNQIYNNNIYSNNVRGVYINSDSADFNIIKQNKIWGRNQDRAVELLEGDHNIIMSNHLYYNYYEGVYLGGSAWSNTIIRNKIWDNNRYGVFLDTDASYNNIITNIIFSNASVGIYIEEPHDNRVVQNDVYGPDQNYGVYITSGDRNIICSNYFSFHDNDGITQYGDTGMSNYYSRNIIFSNTRYGIFFYGGNNMYNIIATNIIYGNSSLGIYINAGDNNDIYRNLIYNNGSCGIELYNTANNCIVVNNTIVGNGHSGVYVYSAQITNIYNNILMSNARYGVEIYGTGQAKCDYNIFHNNVLDAWDTGVNALGNNILDDPMIDTVTSYTILSAISPCVDHGKVIPLIATNYYGLDPDIGWKESRFTNRTATNYYVRIYPMNIRTRTISEALDSATNNCVIECYVKSNGFYEAVIISGFTNLTLQAFAWTNSQDNSNTVIWGDILEELIFITNSKHITVQGFSLTNALYNGILIKNAVSNNILHNRIYNNARNINGGGVKLEGVYASHNVIASNMIFDKNLTLQEYGVWIEDSKHNTVYSNRIIHNRWYGVYLTSIAESNTIEQNLIYSNASVGVYLYSDSADYNQIHNNIIHGPGQPYGIYFRGADNNHIVSNRIYKHTSSFGIYFYTGTTLTMNSNYISHNHIFSNSEGIYIRSGYARNNDIMSNTIYDNYDCGIYLRSPNYTTVIGNRIFNNNFTWQQHYGVYILNGDNNVIRSNIIYHNQDYGVYLGGTAQYNEVRNNVIISNYDNHLVYIDTTDADYNIICSNRISGAYYDGIYVYGGDYNDIFRNTIDDNRIGIYIRNGAYFNNIHNNTIIKNSDAGIENYRASAYVYNNIIMSNNSYGLDSTDNGSTNYWLRFSYNTFYGNQPNYWDVNDSRLLNGKYNHTNFHPYIQTIYPFAIQSPFSFAIDTATNIPGITDSWRGGGPDRGWMESPYTNISYYEGPFYVDDDSGNDLYDGSFDYPFRTIQQAAYRMTHGSNITSATCYIFPGEYNEDVTIGSNYYNGYIVFTKLSNTAPVVNGEFTRTYGFYIENADRIIIKDLIIKQYDYGVFLNNNSLSNYIINNYIYTNNTYAVCLNSDNVDYNHIINNSISGILQNSGIYINYGDYNRIRNNYLHHQDRGVVLNNNAQYNTISHNWIMSNRYSGIYMDHPFIRYNDIYTNYIKGPNQSKGIAIYSGDYNTIKSNQILDHDGMGIHYFNDSIGNQIINNNISGNKTNGIYIQSGLADNNYIISNLIKGTAQDYGITISDGDYQVMRNNRIYSNNNTGVYILDSSGSVLSNNVMSHNREGIKQENSSVRILLNSITNNTNGMRFISGSLDPFTKNNIYNNSRYNFITVQPNQSITNNWWGSTVASVIASKISNNGGYSNFTPYRLFGPFKIDQEADTFTPPRLTGFNVTLSNEFVKLIWNQTQDVDFKRYRIYRSDIPGTTNLTSSLVITNITSSAITQFKDNPGNGTWYYTITAADDPGSILVPINTYTNECWYADVLNVTIISTTEIALSKSISNIRLAGVQSEPVPGATITYIIIYSNIGNASGNNVVIYDHLPSSIVYYHTNSISTAVGWTLQFSTNSSPTQTYNSSDYSNGYISKQNIKWIRWRKPSVAISEDNRALMYKVIIR